MIYQAAITESANTAQADATRTVIPVTRGLIWSIEVQFPPGCSGLAHLQLFDGKYQLFPASNGQSLAADGAILSYDDLYYKGAAPFVLVAKTWNLDDTYPHTMTVRVGMASNPAFMSRYLPGVNLGEIDATLGKIREDQAAIRRAQLEAALSDINPE